MTQEPYPNLCPTLWLLNEGFWLNRHVDLAVYLPEHPYGQTYPALFHPSNDGRQTG